MVLRDLLASPGVVEVCELRSRFGFLAVHGGSLEQVTDQVAIESARLAEASVYAIQQPIGFRWHVPAIAMDPSDSIELARFLDHVDVLVSVHGFGIDSLWARTGRPSNGRSVTPDRSGVGGEAATLPTADVELAEADLAMALLLGGGNRDLAATLGSHLRPALPDYRVVTQMEQIPVRLRGVHPANPVNLPRDGGVQLELCPSVRGLGVRWRHLQPGERPRETGALVRALAAAARSVDSDRG